MKVVGVETQVSYDRDDLLEAAWELFAKSEVAEYLDNDKESDDIISVYHKYTGDYSEPYSLLIGYEVADDYPTPNGLNEVIIHDNHEEYIVKGELPDALFDMWEDIYDDEDNERAYKVDYERYNPKDDRVSIFIEYVD